MTTLNHHADAAGIWLDRATDEQGRQALIKWINDAEGIERLNRKSASFVYLYGGSPSGLQRALEAI